MNSSYAQQDLGNGSVRFTITPAWEPTPLKPSKVPLGVGIAFAVVMLGTQSPNAGFFAWIVRWVIAIGGGYGVFRFLKWRVARNSPGAGRVVTTSLTTSPAGIQGETGPAIARDNIVELLWRDWSTDGDDSASCSLYVETRQDDSLIIATGLDPGTAARLAADVGQALGGIKVTGGKPAQVSDLPA